MSTGQQRSLDLDRLRPSRPWPARSARWPAARPRSSRRRTWCSRPAPRAARFGPCAAGTSSRCRAPRPGAPGRGRRRRCRARASTCRRCRRRCRGESAPRRAGAPRATRRCGGRTRSVPARRMCSATASVVERDWQKNRLFCPVATLRRVAGRAARDPGGGRRGAAGAPAASAGRRRAPAAATCPAATSRIASGLPTVARQPDALDVVLARRAPGARSRSSGARRGRSRRARGPRR